MNNRLFGLLLALGLMIGGSGSGLAQQPNLSGNWIKNGGRTTWGEWYFTEEGKRRFDAYDFKTDDPALQCVGTSWTRIWLNPNVLVVVTQAEDQVRLQYEWMDIDRRIPLVDPTLPSLPRGSIEGHPGLGHFAAWYDGDALVIDTVDIAPGYVSTMSEFSGLPQSRRMRTVERITRAGDLLTIEITHVDPANYQKPLVVTITYPRSDFELMDYGCNPEDAAIVEPD